MNSIDSASAMLYRILNSQYTQILQSNDSEIQYQRIPVYCGFIDMATSRLAWIFYEDEIQPIVSASDKRYQKFFLREDIRQFEGRIFPCFKTLSLPSHMPHNWTQPPDFQLLRRKDLQQLEILELAKFRLATDEESKGGRWHQQPPPDVGV